MWPQSGIPTTILLSTPFLLSHLLGEGAPPSSALADPLRTEAVPAQEGASASDGADDAPIGPTASVEHPHWSFAIWPYLWAASMDTTIRIDGIGSVDLDADFSDIVDELDFAFMIQFEARAPGGDWGIYLDSLYFDLSGAQDAFDWGLEQRLLEIGVAKRVGKGVDLYAAGRYVDIESDATGSILGLSASGSEDWIDPVVGARGVLPLGKHWSLSGRGDVGGFGVGSELTWQLAGYARYAFSTHFELALGYRHLDIDYEEDALELDLALSGPVLGLGFRF